MRDRFPVSWPAGAILWLALILGGFRALAGYEFAAGPTGVSPAEWPRDATVARSPDAATLVVAIHPRCPCTRASIGELARLMARAGGRLSARALFLAPDAEAAGWERTDLWASAAAIPGVSPVVDPGGRLSALFGAKTSGHVLLYDRAGRLVFSGGITPSRGHAGDSAGAGAVLAHLGLASAGGLPAAPVFGCPLEDRCGLAPRQTGREARVEARGFLQGQPRGRPSLEVPAPALREDG